MTRDEFIQFISDDLTASGSIPVSLNTKEIERIIDAEKEWVFREWRDSFEEKWTVLPPQTFKTQEFKASRTIQLPDCVLAIKEFREIKDGGRLFGISDPEFSMDRVMAADLWLSPFSSDTITYRTIQWSFWDLTKSFQLNEIQYKFNVNTHRLNVLGRTPDSGVLIRCLCKIEDSRLFEDPIFRRWVIAKCKISMARILGTFTLNLIGGITVNADMWKSEGQEELTELKEKMKSDNACDWFISFN